MSKVLAPCGPLLKALLGRVCVDRGTRAARRGPSSGTARVRWATYRPFSRNSAFRVYEFWFRDESVELSHGAHANLKFLIQCLCFPWAEITGVYHHGLKKFVCGHHGRIRAILQIPGFKECFTYICKSELVRCMRCSQRPQAVVGFLGAGVTGLCERTWQRRWELNLGPLEEQQVLSC